MKGSLHVGTYFSIPVKVHWSFGLLVLFVIYAGFTRGMTAQEGMAFGFYVLALFFCVILHEYGHALAAKRYGIGTEDIIISPIGGVARLKTIPKEPLKEMVVAIAGPLVNVLIALVLGTITFILYDGGILPSNFNDLSLLVYPSEFIRFLVWVNIALFFFNLIPAFPMDGGRILRAGLSLFLDRLTATKWASYLGRLLAVGLLIYGLLQGQVILGMIGVFIYAAAKSEYENLKSSHYFHHTPISKFALTDYTTFNQRERLGLPIEKYLQGPEKNFLVVDDGGVIVGSLPRVLLESLQQMTDVSSVEIHQAMSRQILHLDADASINNSFQAMNNSGASIALIMKDGEHVGIVDRDKMQSILDRRQPKSN